MSANEPSPSLHFIQDIITGDLKTNKWGGRVGGFAERSRAGASGVQLIRGFG